MRVIFLLGISQKLNGKYKKIYALRSTIRWEFLSQATLNKYPGRLSSPTHLRFYTGIGAVHKDIFCPIFKSLSWNVVWLRIKFLPPALRNKNDIDPSTECNNWNIFKECFMLIFKNIWLIGKHFIQYIFFRFGETNPLKYCTLILKMTYLKK